MKMALAGDQCPAGLALELIRSLESCDWTRCEGVQQRLNLADFSQIRLIDGRVPAFRGRSARLFFRSVVMNRNPSPFGRQAQRDHAPDAFGRARNNDYLIS